MNADELRATAERYRQMALTLSDPRATAALKELAAEYEAQASRLEQPQGGDATGRQPDPSEAPTG